MAKNSSTHSADHTATVRVRQQTEAGVKPRRNPKLLSLAIALIVVGGLGAAWFATTSSKSESVFVTSTNLLRGSVITSSDLTTLQISDGQITSAYTVAQADQLIGRTATADLPAGSLVTSSNTATNLAVGNDESILGLSLKTSQLPSVNLYSGDTVRIVTTPISQGDPPTVNPITYTGTIFTTSYDQASSTYKVDLIVNQGQAALIAATAATGRIVLILDGK